MFLDFFYLLRSKKVPVTSAEYLDLLKVLSEIKWDEPEWTLKRFYQLARSCLVKDIKHYDSYDLAFAEQFGGLTGSTFQRQLKEWLETALNQNLSDEQKRNALKIPTEELLKELEKRLKEQKSRHDGGNKWIGTGGTSPFGHSGFNPQGIRIGGEGRNRSAIAVAGDRQFRGYRHDETLEVRQIKMALKKLRDLRSLGKPTISVPDSIKETCRNGGEVELVLKRSRKNQIRLLLLMDVGGSMTPHSQKVARLFSAAHQLNHFKEFQPYYFHNIFYDYIYFNARLHRADSLSIEALSKHWPPTTKIIIVGDALMAPYELTLMNQSIYDGYRYLSRSTTSSSGLTGIAALAQLVERFPSAVWLNPEPIQYWGQPTIQMIREVVPMFHLSLQGLQEAIVSLS